MKAIFIITLMALLLLCELLLGCIGLFLPLTVFGMIYCAATLRPFPALLAGMVPAMILDLLCGRSVAVGAVASLLTVLVGMTARRHRSGGFFTAAFFGGVGFGVYTAVRLGAAAVEYGISDASWGLLPANWLFCVLLGALLTPPCIRLFDAAARVCALEPYEQPKTAVGRGAAGDRS